MSEDTLVHSHRAKSYMKQLLSFTTIINFAPLNSLPIERTCDLGSSLIVLEIGLSLLHKCCHAFFTVVLQGITHTESLHDWTVNVRVIPAPSLSDGLFYSLLQRWRGISAFPNDCPQPKSAQKLQSHRGTSSTAMKLTHNLKKKKYYKVLHTCINSFFSHSRD